MPEISPIIKPAKVMLIGEAPGQSEEMFSGPFLGASGQELARLLHEAKIIDEAPGYGKHWSELKMLSLWKSSGLALTNVFLQRPPQNKLDPWCVAKGNANVLYKSALPMLQHQWPSAPWPSTYSFPPLRPGKYLHPDYLSALPRLFSEITEVKPNLIIALGATATWALLGNTAISKIRGAIAESDGVKVLPTYHPAYVLRNWSDRVVVSADLLKAKREMQFPEIKRPQRFIWIEPTLADLEEFYDKYLKDAGEISCDIETAWDQITCIGFAPNEQHALVVPLTDESKPGYNYWPSAEEEVQAHLFIRKVLAHPAVKIGQNFLYDLQWIWKVLGIPVSHCHADTMILHHAMQPELEKGLGFLGSIYTNEASWKLMRRRSGETEGKNDE